MPTSVAKIMPAPYRFEPTILREYDVRGVVGETLHTPDAYAIGRAYASLYESRNGNLNGTIAVCRDGRLSSPELEGALVRGLNDGGLNVCRVGIGPTPELYFAVFHLNTDGGIMVTGSHNPANHNGFKMMMGKKSLMGSDIQEMGQLAANGSWTDPVAPGTISTASVKEPYIQNLLAAYDGTRPLYAVWDAGNGAGGEIMAALCERLPGTHIALNPEIDGHFPVHHPDPSVEENMLQLMGAVKERGADVGLAFDGDADRLGVCDNKGRILWGDQIMAWLAGDILRQQPGSIVIADVKASQMLFDSIAENGGKPLMWKTGHSLVKSKMAEVGAPLAGEMSGHIFYADHFGFDDGLYAAVKFLGILSRSGTTLSDWLDSLPAWKNTPEMRITCTEERKFKIIDEVKARLDLEKTDYSNVDGVRVTTKDGWWLLRASNTQAVLVARCESRTEDGLERLIADLTRHMNESGVELKLAAHH